MWSTLFLNSISSVSSPSSHPFLHFSIGIAATTQHQARKHLVNRAARSHAVTMPPRQTRAARKADGAQDAPEAAQTAAAESSETADLTVDVKAPESTSAKSKGKAKAARHQPLLPESAPTEPAASRVASAPVEPSESTPCSSSSSKPTMEDRQARLSALRAKMAASTRANRKDILSEQSRTRSIASELKNASGSRKLHRAEKILEERDLRESGEDVERHRNMNYSLEESERWDAKLEEKERRKDQGPGDFGDAAERAYQRQLRLLKPDVSGYRKQRDDAEAIKASSPASGALVRRGKGKSK